MRIPDYPAAFAQYALADSVYKRHNMPERVTSAIRLALIENIYTKSDEAIFRLDNVNRLLDKTTRQNRMQWHQQRGRAYEDIGDIEQAGTHYRTALQEAQTEFGNASAQTAYALMFMARYHSFKKANDSSYWYSAKAYQIWQQDREGRDSIRQAELLLQHAFDTKNRDLLSGTAKRAQYDTVRSLYAQALTVIRNTYSRISAEEAAVYQGLANSYNDFLQIEFACGPEQGERCWTTAVKYYDKSIRIKESLYSPVHRSVSVSYYTRALMFDLHPDTLRMKAGLWEYQKAMRAAVNHYMPVDGFSLPEGRRVVFPYQLNVILTQYVYLANKLHKKTGNIRYLETAHRANLFRLSVWDEIVARFASSSSGNTIWIWVNAPFEESVCTGYDLYKLTGNQAYLDQVFSAIERGRYNDFAEQIIRQQKSTQGVVRSNNAYSIYKTCISLRQLQRSLDEKSAYIALVARSSGWRERSFGIAVTRNGIILEELPQPGSIDSLNTALMNAMRVNNPQDCARAARLLYQRSLDPLISKLPASTSELILSVNGVYASVPFDALLSADPVSSNDFRTMPYLMDRFRIRHCLSATQLVQRTKSQPKPLPLVLFTPGFERHADLPFSRKSANQLHQRYTGQVYSDHAATNFALREALGEEAIIHVASHAHSNDGDANKSTLFLQGQQGQDSLVLGSLYACSVRSPLVVVAACETGSGKEQYAEGSRSFTRAMLFAGAAATLGTLWKVDDKATAEVLELFYAELSGGCTPSEALRNARKNYRNTRISSESANPFFWSGLVFTGENMPILLQEKSALLPLWFSVAGVLFLLLVYRVVKKRRNNPS